jgi:hypothetical protein
MSFEGYSDQLLNPDDDPDEDLQDHIFHLLIQIVHDPEGFAKLRAIEGLNDVTCRGHRAWTTLRNHYLQVGSVRLMTLQHELKKPQQTHETGSMFVTRMMNNKLDLKECGEDISDSMMKNYIIEGLRDEYQPYVSAIYDQLHTKDIEDF